MENKISRSLLTSNFLRKILNVLTLQWLFSFFLNFTYESEIPWLFPDLEKISIFQIFFPDCGNPDFFLFFFLIVLLNQGML